METSIKEIEGKEVVEFSGPCPVCNKVITFNVSNDLRVNSNQLAAGIYEMFLNNNEVCFECRLKLENWVKVHKEFCLSKGLDYRAVGNRILEKMGKKPVIGLTTLVSEEIEPEAVQNEILKEEDEADELVSKEAEEVSKEEDFKNEVLKEVTLQDLVSPEEEVIIETLKGGDEK